MASSKRHPTYAMTYTDRASIRPNNPLNVYLLRLMVAKETNLCLSADVQSTSQLLDIAEECGRSICILKTHADIVHDFGEKTIKGLMEIAGRKKFMIFEDRKFGDIGNTVQTQYAGGTYKIAQWASIVNAHIFPGPAIVTSLRSAAMSSLAASNSRISTEISGGGPLPRDEDSRSGYFTMEKNPSRASSKKSSAPSSDDDANAADGDDSSEGEATPSAESHWGIRRPVDQDGRKGSVVSVSTTISSSAEYISPPNASPAETPTTNIPAQAPLARGLLLLAQMSSKDNLLGPEYTRKCVEIAQEHRDFVLGFIAQEMLNTAPEDNFLVMTPGISLPPGSSSAQLSAASREGTGRSGLVGLARQKPGASSDFQLDSSASSGGDSTSAQNGDGQGQQYNTPRHAVLEKGVDVIIVGRGITGAENRGREAERYRKEGWAAYLERVGAKSLPAKTRGSATAAGQPVGSVSELPMRGREG